MDSLTLLKTLRTFYSTDPQRWAPSSRLDEGHCILQAADHFLDLPCWSMIERRYPEHVEPLFCGLPTKQKLQASIEAEETGDYLGAQTSALFWWNDKVARGPADVIALLDEAIYFEEASREVDAFAHDWTSEEHLEAERQAREIADGYDFQEQARRDEPWRGQTFSAEGETVDDFYNGGY